MGSMPKPPGQAVRRNLDQPGWTTYDEAESPTEAPQWPGAVPPQQEAMDYWNAIWTSPMARAFLPVDLVQVARICRMHALEIRGGLSVTGQAELRMLEDSFGISPRSRRTLRWEIERAAPGQSDKPQPLDGERKRRQSARDRLSVVSE